MSCGIDGYTPFLSAQQDDGIIGLAPVVFNNITATEFLLTPFDSDSRRFYSEEDSYYAQSITLLQSSQLTWAVTPPARADLISRLDSDVPLNLVFSLSFKRAEPATDPVTSRQFFEPLTNVTRLSILEALQNPNSDPDKNVVVIPNLLPRFWQLPVLGAPKVIEDKSTWIDVSLQLVAVEEQYHVTINGSTVLRLSSSTVLMHLLTYTFRSSRIVVLRSIGTYPKITPTTSPILFHLT